MELSLYSGSSIENSIIFILLIGLGFFFVSITCMIVLFGWSLRDALKNTKGMAMFFLISLTLPFGLSELHKNVVSTHASAPGTLTHLEVVPIDEQNVFVTFQTEKLARVYLESTDKDTGEMIPILPTTNFEKSTDHSFVVRKGTQGQDIVFVIDGDRYLINNNPYIIR